MATVRRHTLDEADIHDVLRNRRRRLAIDCLRGSEDGELSVRTLSEQVATGETGEDPPPRDKRQSVYVSLHQTHLPKLHRLGIVEYDDDSKVVRLEDRVREVQLYMEVGPRYGLSWGEFSIGCAVLGLLFVGASKLAVAGFDLLAPDLWAMLALSGVVLSATYDVYSQRGGLPFGRRH
jgi:hypothetical protein